MVTVKAPTTTKKEPLSFGLKVIVGFHIVNCCAWLVGQTLAVTHYDWVASLGLQVPRELTENAVVQVNRAIGIADTLVLNPLYAMAAAGLMQRKFYGVICSWMAFALSMYWPAIFWGTLITYSSGKVEYPPVDGFSMGVTMAVFAFSVWGSWFLCRSKEMLLWWQKEF